MTTGGSTMAPMGSDDHGGSDDGSDGLRWVHGVRVHGVQMGWPLMRFMPLVPNSLCLAWDHYHAPREEPGNSIARAEVLATISLLPERGVPVLGIANMQHHIIIE